MIQRSSLPPPSTLQNGTRTKKMRIQSTATDRGKMRIVGMTRSDFGVSFHQFLEERSLKFISEIEVWSVLFFPNPFFMKQELKIPSRYPYRDHVWWIPRNPCSQTPNGRMEAWVQLHPWVRGPRPGPLTECPTVPT